MNSVSGDHGKIAVYAADLAALGVKLLPPDINASSVCFSPSDDRRAVIFGFQSLKGVGERLSDRICRERENGRYVSFDDFAKRLASPELGDKQLEALVCSGAFDRLGQKRSVLFSACRDVAEKYRRNAENPTGGQIGLFDDEARKPYEGYSDIPEWDDKEKERLEREVCGISFTGAEKQAAGNKAPKRLFVRVGGTDCKEYRRAAALCRIFEGNTPVWFYDAVSGSYRLFGSSDTGGALVKELTLLLGRENVVLK
jgi:DNA polymerase III alpha subunit